MVRCPNGGSAGGAHDKEVASNVNRPGSHKHQAFLVQVKPVQSSPKPNI